MDKDRLYFLCTQLTELRNLRKECVQANRELRAKIYNLSKEINTYQDKIAREIR